MNGQFRSALLALKAESPFSACIYVHEPDEYNRMRTFLTDDGMAGFALQGPNKIVSVFVNPRSAYRGSARAVVATAVGVGGRTLECFDTKLPAIYAAEGFKPVARLDWDDDLRPLGWDYQTFAEHNDGRPDVVFMAYDSDRLDSVYDPTEGRRVTSHLAGSSAAVVAATGQARSPFVRAV